jgi:putative tryptophan/tyrosine transport system substrate-binding protein
MQRFMVGCLLLLTCGLVMMRRAAEPQPTEKVYRIGFLSEAVWPIVPAYLEALRGLGYVEGHNLVVERRSATQGEPLSALAAAVVTHQVDLIITDGTQATQAAQQATTTIPIFFILGSDPVRSGLIASYARPGGNLTGLVFGLYGDKQLALLKEAIPEMVRIACLCNGDRTNPAWDQFADTARGLGVEILVIRVDGPDGFDDFFAAARRAGANAVVVAPLPWLLPHLRRLGELTAQSRFPAIGHRRDFAEGGGLFSFGHKPEEIRARVAAQVDKLLKGAKPADLPVEHPMRFELVINLKTAHALGFTMPPTLLLQADTVIR